MSPSSRPSTGSALDADERFMRRAIDLATRGQGHVEPNPMVGCVLVRNDQVIAEGFHRRFGGPHAEIDALDALSSRAEAAGATAYVSLEPCCHHGKTPPCTEALIDARIARVVIAMTDPFPQVDGGGIAQLSRAGVQTTVGVLGQEAEAINAPYLKRVRTGKPWVIAKWAMTIDGRIATAARDSQWITSPQSRAQTHALRGRVDAIAVGMGTVRHDNPLLTARLPDDQRPPRVATRIVLCRHHLPALDCQLVQTAGQVPLVVVISDAIPIDRCDPLRDRGVEIVETGTEDPTAMVDAALRWMGSQSMTNLMLEGGSELLASFFEADQIDECHVYVGAKAVGGAGAPGPIGGQGVATIADASLFALQSIDVLEHDLRAVYRRFRPE